MRYPNSQSRGSRTAMKTKEQSFFFFYSGRAAPAFLPASRAKSCLYRAFPTTTHAPSAWLALSHQGTAKPTPTVHNQAGPAHNYTYPNTRLPTINHYSGGLMGLGGWWGCFLQITQPRWLSGPQQHPQPHSFSHSKPMYSSASYPWHKIDRLHVLFCF